MSPYTAYRVRRGGRVFSFPLLERASWRFNAHPDGSGTDWEEDVDVDQPHGLDYRYINHVAKAYRKRNDKEHEGVGDSTAGGEHIPGYAQVLRQVDGTADVSGAYDSTLFQANGIVHAAGNQTLWCVTGAAGDPTICLLDPDKQYKGGDVTWTGAAQFDASVDMTILHVDASATFHGAAQFDASVNFDGVVDLTDTQIDGTLTVLDRADFSSVGVAGDATFAGGVELDGAVQIDGSAQVNGLACFGASNVYDSSWFDCSVGGLYTKTHDLSSTALLTQLFYKDTENQFSLGDDRVYGVFQYVNGENEYGASVNNVTATALSLQAGINGTNVAFNAAGGAVASTCGQYRVIAMRLI